MKDGFFTALGTPIDEFGNLISSSFEKQIKDQVEAGASGVLVMGSMGCGPCVKQSDFTKIVDTAAKAAGGKCSVLVGVMDNSAARVIEKAEALKGFKIDGVVSTTPYYFEDTTQEDLKEFFKRVANSVPFPLYLYDLPSATQIYFAQDTLNYLLTVDNIRGIKTGNIATAKLMKQNKGNRNFDVVFSNVDAFDVAYQFGIKKNLDGMFSCTPWIAEKMYKCLANKDNDKASDYLGKILELRNLFLKVEIWMGYTYAMNLLGYEGIFAPDYGYRYDKENYGKVKDCMVSLGML
jgi:4-hydroxy-tetrahydrodipicolinate synthase